MEAQHSVSVDESRANLSLPDGLAARERLLADISIKDTPLSEVVDQLRDTFPEINFIITGDANNFAVTLQLRSVNLDDILMALTIASNDQIEVEEVNERLVTIRPVVREARKPMLRAFNLSSYLAKRGGSEEENEEALQEVYDVLINAWEMFQSANHEMRHVAMPSLSHHRNTKLLIVVGLEEHLQVIEQVVNALQGGASVMGRGYGGGFGGGFSGMGGGGGYGGGGMGLGSSSNGSGVSNSGSAKPRR